MAITELSLISDHYERLRGIQTLSEHKNGKTKTVELRTALAARLARYYPVKKLRDVSVTTHEVCILFQLSLANLKREKYLQLIF